MNFKKISIAMIAILILALPITLLIGVLMPNIFTIERSIEINAPAAEIFPYINSPRQWMDWTPWNATMDSTIEYSYYGPLEGVEAMQIWEGDNIGEGSMTIKISDEPDSIVYNVLFNGNYGMNGKFRLEESTANKTKVSWIMQGQNNPVQLNRKLMAKKMDEKMGAPRMQGLENLKKLVEGKPTYEIDSIK